MTAVKLEDARRVISAAEKKAREIGQPMNIAVADEGGNIVAHVRMDNAWIGSIDISMKKAHTSRDPTCPTSFPDNGRTLTDEAFDFLIRILTNRRVAEDKVGPHGDLLLEFPRVRPPHQSRVTKTPHKTTATQNKT